ncbi:futalosine hydrolase [Brevibacillus ruminantium]|uniref:Futalosine hydrolase n=1 Tax=Brevibacillus ruminantium TaxID=2950604 RepID=A0ABY4WCN1_9BACL|nr:futalosine hydrolase [Brevibacillus ruminantium]USG64822.1 futalosine hydrolase [Brevibacillus ruminantium]
MNPDNKAAASLPPAAVGQSGASERILVMVSVPPERDAVLRGLGGDGRFDVRIGGVGAVAAAVSTAKILATNAAYRLVICAGIAGGFVGRAEIGSLVVADEIIAADLGAETAEGFCSVDELGFGSARVQVDATLAARMTEKLQAAGLSVCMGPILTVSTVTGTAETTAELAARVPGAAAEAMEGYGVASAAKSEGLPALEIRAVSNAIGPRDREAWRIKDALNALESACHVLREVLS